MSDPHPMTPEGLALRLRSVARAMAVLEPIWTTSADWVRLAIMAGEMVGAAAVAVGWADGIDADLVSRHK